jgi:hypothetical protein
LFAVLHEIIQANLSGKKEKRRQIAVAYCGSGMIIISIPDPDPTLKGVPDPDPA